MIKNDLIHEYVYFDQTIMNYDKVEIGLAANSLQYGGTVFGGIRGYAKNGKYYIFRLNKHFERLMTSSKIMYFDFEIEYTKFKKIIKNLLEKNKPSGEFYIRPFIFSTTPAMGPKYYTLEFQLAIYTQDLAKLEPGLNIKALISSIVKYSDSAIPTKAKAGGAYVNSALAAQEAYMYGVEEALLFDANGYLAEATVANVIINYNNQFYTPLVGSAALNGITLQTIKAEFKKFGLEIIETNIDRSMLLSSKEIILVGTAAKFKNVTDLNGVKIFDENNTNILNETCHKIFKGLEENGYYQEI
jgi:branched-chain amino acid aminotransferase